MGVNSVISVVCLQAFVGSPCELIGFCSSVKICERENIQRASCVLNAVREKTSNKLHAFFLSQNYTEEQNTQRTTETLSQPITQSVSAHDGCKFCDICRLPAGVCGFPLLAERPLFICENL